MEQPRRLYPDFVVPDELMPLNIDGMDDTRFMIGRKYDMVHYFPQVDHHVLKVYDDELGMVTMHVDAATAAYVCHEAGLEMHEREKMTVSEYEGYMQCQANTLEQWFDND